ncbi:MAG: MBL fold metallo-hydrolase [Clostridia bacterium]|nr:MBL fold metallo-hydrolase [Clostridia bacterium]MDR3643932.1 MBL fold metallo-hydrolase [Clostridia bacterium]
MAFFCSLFSGSSGNCALVGCGGAAVLIDAGASARAINNALTGLDMGIGDIAAVLVTHEHSDHIKGLPTLISRYKLPVYANAGTIRGILGAFGAIDPQYITELETGGSIELAGMSIRSFKTSHDSLESVGYTIATGDGRRIAVATDLGYVTEEVMRSLTGCAVVMLESNHDIGMLKNGSYPYFLKRRILSDRGHLSNDGCAQVLPKLVESGTKHIILAHLSHDNNLPELAEQTAVSALKTAGHDRGGDYELEAAPRFAASSLCCV